MKSSSEREYYHEADRPIRSITVASPTGPYSQSNRRVSAICGVQRCYPWLLFATTAVAAAFCFAYITKPVIISESVDVLEIQPSLGKAESSAPTKSILPNPSKLPGEKQAGSNQNRSAAIPSAPNSQGFEETNLRMQHILDAESPSGDIHRMVIDVPVLYKSRNLRWSQQEVAEARTLLTQLEQHQEQTRALRDQGKLLLHNWNTLVNTSIPDQILRADSPSLPINQSNNKISAVAPSSDAVKLQNDKK
jgi:hypothetical protein